MLADAANRLKILDRCPECGGDALIEDHDVGEVVCESCGLVITEQTMDRGPGWRAFTPEEKVKRKRTGLPTSYAVYDKGLSTSIREINRDAYGRKLPLKLVFKCIG